MQGLADGYFVIPYTIGNYLAGNALPKVSTDREEFKQAALDSQEKINKLLAVKGNKTALEFHRELGHIVWDHIGMARNEEGLLEAIQMISDLKHEFWSNVKVVGEANNLNQNLEHASPRRRFHRVGRTDGFGCAQPRREQRRSFPRGIPDARRRGQARR